MEITDEVFAWAKRRYYELMKWDAESATPSEECLERLQLKELLTAAAQIESAS
jgi:aldehyde:ferredoxin oxidoreductase